jgi:hypothetical protein
MSGRIERVPALEGYAECSYQHQVTVMDIIREEERRLRAETAPSQSRYGSGWPATCGWCGTAWRGLSDDVVPAR